MPTSGHGSEAVRAHGEGLDVEHGQAPPRFRELDIAQPRGVGAPPPAPPKGRRTRARCPREDRAPRRPMRWGRDRGVRTGGMTPVYPTIRIRAAAGRMDAWICLSLSTPTPCSGRLPPTSGPIVLSSCCCTDTARTSAICSASSPSCPRPTRSPRSVRRCPRLADTRSRVVPHRGAAGTGNRRAVTDAARAVLRWLDEAAGTAPAIGLLGFSQGAAVALQALRLAPERFAFALALSGYADRNPFGRPPRWPRCVLPCSGAAEHATK